MKTQTILTVAICAFAPPAATAAKADRKPNVIFILSDDQGYRDLGCYGSPDLLTPNIDEIAKSGTKFTQFYAGAAVSAPSRASLLTGRSSLEAGLTTNTPRLVGDPFGNLGLPTTNPTIAKNLRANGYYTALIGKWHLGEGRDQRPMNNGFDYFFGIGGGCTDNYSHFFYWSGPNIHDLYRNDEEVYYPGQYFPALITKEVCRIIEEKKSTPFFIYCAFNVPHYPYQGDIKWLDYYTKKGLKSPRKEYVAFVTTMDELIGQIVAKLKKEGVYDNTIIIFQADQGYSVEERAMFGGGDAGNLRGCKTSLFEGGIRVPAIISWPGKLPQGQTINKMAFGVDWYNTIAELTGATPNPQSQGTSLVPLITGKTDSHPDLMVWEYGGFDDNKNQWAVRSGDWKLIGNVADPRAKRPLSAADKKLFLANIAMDETESENLASKYPEKVAELQQIHDQWREKAKQSPEYRAGLAANNQLKEYRKSNADK